MTFAWLLKTGAGDVQLSAAEKAATYRAPLFVCPNAVSAMASFGVNPIEKLVSAAKEAHVLRPDDTLGRQAIGHVLKCKPTLYTRLLHTCNVINFYFHRRGDEPPIAATDIVVCAFRILHYSALRDLFGFTDETLAAAARVPVAFTKSLAANYRLHLAPVLLIFGALRDAAIAAPEVGADIGNGLGERLRKMRNGDAHSFIVADAAEAGRLNVQKVEPFDRGEAHYLLNSDNVRPAPASGHPWEWPPELRQPPE